MFTRAPDYCLKRPRDLQSHLPNIWTLSKLPRKFVLTCPSCLCNVGLTLDEPQTSPLEDTNDYRHLIGQLNCCSLQYDQIFDPQTQLLLVGRASYLICGSCKSALGADMKPTSNWKACFLWLFLLLLRYQECKRLFEIILYICRYLFVFLYVPRFSESTRSKTDISLV